MIAITACAQYESKPRVPKPTAIEKSYVISEKTERELPGFSRQLIPN